MSTEPQPTTAPPSIPDLEQIPAIASATMISGPTGSGKTSLIATFAEYVWERFGRTTLYYSCDAGGYTERLQALIALGVVRAFRMRTRGEAFETCQRSTQGWWPAEINPLTGEVAQNVDMIPPVIQEFTMSCPKDGTMVRRVPQQSLLLPVVCSTCKQMVNVQNGVFFKAMKPSPTFHPAGMPEVGAVAYDGLTSMGDWLMNDMADRTARGDLVGEKTALGGKIRSGALDFGSNNRAHYGFAQSMVEKLIINTISIPGLVAPPLWTALEGRVDPETGMDLPEYGPLIPGQAKTRKVPQWVGNYLGAVQVMGKDGKRSWRLYTVEYRGEDGVPHKYKIRSDPGGIREFYEDGPGEEAFTTFNLGRLFSDLEASFGTTYAKLKAKYANAPGVGKVERVEVGPQVNLEAEGTPNTLTNAYGTSPGGTSDAAAAQAATAIGRAAAGAPAGRAAGAPPVARAVARAAVPRAPVAPTMVKPGGGDAQGSQEKEASPAAEAAVAPGPGTRPGVGAGPGASPRPVARATPVGARILPPKAQGGSGGSGGADSGGGVVDGGPARVGEAGLPAAGVGEAAGGVREGGGEQGAAGGDGVDASRPDSGGTTAAPVPGEDGAGTPDGPREAVAEERGAGAPQARARQAAPRAQATSSKVPGAPPSAPRPPQAAPVKGVKDARGRG